MEMLNDLIRAGWGDVRGDRIPSNWREVTGPGGTPVRYDHDGYVIWIDPLEAERLSMLSDGEGSLTLEQRVMANERQRTYTRRRTWEQRITERAATFSGAKRRRRSRSGA